MAAPTAAVRIMRNSFYFVLGLSVGFVLWGCAVAEAKNFQVVKIGGEVVMTSDPASADALGADAVCLQLGTDSTDGVSPWTQLIKAADSTNANGGALWVQGGDSGGTAYGGPLVGIGGAGGGPGGVVSFVGGAAGGLNYDGGIVQLNGGPGSGSGAPGKILLGNVRGQTVVGPLGIEFTESSPPCPVGKYFVYADAATKKLRKCEDGVVSDL